MSKTILAFLGGLGLGVVVVWGLAATRSHDVEAEAARLRAEITQERETTAAGEAKAAAERSRLEAELAAAHAELDAARVAAAPTAPTTEAADAEQKRQFQEMVRKVGAGQIKGRLEGKLAALKARLHLTPEQEAQLKEKLEGQVEDMLAALDRFMAGQGAPTDFGKLARLQRGELSAEVESLLTPEQRAGYAVFQAEDRANRIEMKANAELIGLQSAGGMTPEQKDLAFARLSELATVEESVDFDAMQDAAAIRAFMDDAVQKRYTALQDILTEPQMEIYRQQVAAQMQMLSQFLPAQ